MNSSLSTHVSGLSRYTTLTAYDKVGPADATMLIVQSGASASLHVHQSILSTFSTVLRETIGSTVKAIDPVSGLVVIPLQGDCIVDWRQALIALYMLTQGSSHEDQWRAMLVRSSFTACMECTYSLHISVSFTTSIKQGETSCYQMFCDSWKLQSQLTLCRTFHNVVLLCWKAKSITSIARPKIPIQISQTPFH